MHNRLILTYTETTTEKAMLELCLKRIKLKEEELQLYETKLKHYTGYGFNSTITIGTILDLIDKFTK